MTAPAPDLAFCCVADSRYFIGAVGLINSLRLVGHDEPVHLLDCGLTDEQRALLTAHATVVRAPGGLPPWLLKTVIPRQRPDALNVLVDTDMIITRSLAPLIERAASGRLVAFRDRKQRFFTAWGDLPGLGPVRERPYVSSGLVVCDPTVGQEVLGLLDELQPEVDFERTYWRRNVRGYPFLYADQDVLNAILAAAIEPDRVWALDQRLAPTPPFRGVRIIDRHTLRCAYRDGTQPYLVHQYLRKPWLEPTYDGVYSRLLRRLLTGSDVAIRLPPREIPPRLRLGSAAIVERIRNSAADFLRWHLGDRVPEPIAIRIEDRRRRREANHG